jgi:hypothetical protein
MADETEQLAAAGPPSLAEVRTWVGFVLDVADGTPAGRVQGFYVDGGSGEPSWLVAALERRSLLPWRRERLVVAIPVGSCAGAAGRVWTAHERSALQAAPTVDPTRPLLREHELTICSHYGSGEEVGRAAEVTGRPEGSVTSRPA